MADRDVVTEEILRDSITRHRRNISQRLVLQVALARRWREKGEYRRAGLLLALSLDAADHQLGQADPEIVAICNEWGVLGKFSGDFALAQRLYARALETAKTVYGVNHDVTATICHNIGGLYHSSQRYIEGERWAARSVAIRARIDNCDELRLANDRSAWAALLDGCGRYDEAESQLRTALATIEKARGWRHPDVLVILHNLAALQLRRKNYAAAIESHLHVLALKRMSLGEEHPELAPTLVNLASAYAATGLIPPAHAYFEEAVNILAPRVSESHPTLTAARLGLVSTTCG
ncbi:tetratricopeptide repeat protein [Streptomyces sp. NPDC001286]